MKTLTNHRFFPGLNGLRAIAAICVLIEHEGMFLNMFGFQNDNRYNHLFLSGHESVLLFFVLSGFLITYRLLEEQNQTGKINFKNFYRGRALRIAPLQILIVGLSFLIYLLFYGLIPSYHEPVHPLSTYLLLIFIPNVASLVDNVVICGAHVWSLGVENEFYLIWPLLLMRFKQSILRMMISVIFIKIILTIVILPFFISHAYSSNLTNLLAGFSTLFPIESMAVGGLGAWLVFTQKDVVLNTIFNPLSQLITYIAIVWLIYYRFLETQYIETFVVPFIFLSLILNVSCNPRSLFKYQNRVFNYLGKISYGIYMYHPAVIFFTLWFTYKQLPHGNALYIALLYILDITLTIGIAGLSYKYFEAPIMRFKSKNPPIEDTSSIAVPII